MNVSYTVKIKGVREKNADALDEMLREELAKLPQRIAIESVKVEKNVKR